MSEQPNNDEFDIIRQNANLKEYSRNINHMKAKIEVLESKLARFENFELDLKNNDTRTGIEKLDANVSSLIQSVASGGQTSANVFDQDLNTTDDVTHNTLEISDYQDFNEVSPPSSPGAGIERVYAADEGGHAFLHTVDDSGVDLEINRDSVHVVRNETGVAMSKGDVVHISGGNGNFPTVVLADANGTSTTPAHGVLLENISNNAQGLMLSAGDLTNIDLQAFSQGDIVYLSETAGAFTATKPSFPSFQQEIGVVVKNTAAGILAVFITDSNKLLDEDDMSSDSTDFGATQQSIKAYADKRLVADDSTYTQKLLAGFANPNTNDSISSSNAGVIYSPTGAGQIQFTVMPPPWLIKYAADNSLTISFASMTLYWYNNDSTSSYIDRMIIYSLEYDAFNDTSRLDDGTNHTGTGDQSQTYDPANFALTEGGVVFRVFVNNNISSAIRIIGFDVVWSIA